MKGDCSEAGVHPEEQEAYAVTRLIEMCATGSYTLAKVALWINEQGFRAGNTNSLTDSHGNQLADPRKFTICSVLGIPHKPFFAGHIVQRE